MLKKFTIVSLCALVPIIGMAQRTTSDADRFPVKPGKLKFADREVINFNSSDNAARGGAIWSEDFNGSVNTPDSIYSASGAWGKDDLNGNIWKFSTNPTNGCWSTGATVPATSTGNNGFLLFDADSANCQDASQDPPIFTQDPLVGSVVSPIIDLSGQPSVVLSFEYETRWCCTSAGPALTVEVSGDGGATWPMSVAVDLPAINTGEAFVYEANISAVAGNSSQARIRFTWGNESHYYWAVDDILMYPAPADDIRMNYAYVSHNNTAEEYGRIPQLQLQGDLPMGAEVYNFGATAQTNVKLVAEVMDSNGNVVMADSATEASLAPVDTFLFELFPAISSLPIDQYTIEFSVTSDGDSLNGPLGGDNMLERNFEITEALYSIDAIGNHPGSQQVLEEIGTESFTDAADGLMVLSYYDVTTPTWAIGVDVRFAPGSQDGAFVAVALHDTTNVLGEVEDLTSPYAESDLIEVDIQGSQPLFFPFDEPFEIDNPNAFYAGVELFSDNNTNDVAVLDDATIPQPFYSSMIFIADDQVYSNGTASAVRLIVTPNVSVEDYEQSNVIFDLINNPADRALGYTLKTDKNENLLLSVRGINGELIDQYQVNSAYGIMKGEINTSELANGIYTVQLSGEKAMAVRKFVVAH